MKKLALPPIKSGDKNVKLKLQKLKIRQERNRHGTHNFKTNL